MVEDASAVIRRGERVKLLGPMGTGKRTLLRAIAGIWRHGSGKIAVPEDARTAFLPQRPYVPIGTLREAVAYPSPGDAFPDDAIRDALEQVGLGALAPRLDETAHWQQQLSWGEEQRLSIARVLLQKPDWIFLDKATSAVDEASERKLFGLLHERVPGASIVAIANRPGAVQDYEHSWTLVPGPEGSVLRAA
jgi:vitamin B12/bleomycin/antimicrobial peptide transport system ATP-binding/permease protein